MPPVTVTRPGTVAVAAPERVEPPRRRIPTRWKLLAAGLAVGLVGTANVVASEQQKHRDRVAADRVVASAGMAGVLQYGQGEVSLTVFVHNSGAPLHLQTPRVDVPGFAVRAARTLPGSVAPGGTALLGITVTVPCTAGAIAPQTPPRLRLVVPVVPPSGRQRELIVDALPLRGLADESCGYLPLEQALQGRVTGVHLARYDVAFTVTLHNSSSQAVRIDDLTSPGLASSVVGGLPTVADARRDQVLPVRVSILTCAALVGGRAFGTFDLALSSPDGTRGFLREHLERGAPLYEALLTLARRSCPRLAL